CSSDLIEAANDDGRLDFIVKGNQPLYQSRRVAERFVVRHSRNEPIAHDHVMNRRHTLAFQRRQELTVRMRQWIPRVFPQEMEPRSFYRSTGQGTAIMA